MNLRPTINGFYQLALVIERFSGYRNAVAKMILVHSYTIKTGVNMNEQRQFTRVSSSVMVQISHPSFGMIELKAKDLSDGGIFVYLGNHIAPPTGTVVKTLIKRHKGAINEEPVDMRVVHHQSGGMGLMFV